MGKTKIRYLWWAQNWNPVHFCASDKGAFEIQLPSIAIKFSHYACCKKYSTPKAL